MQNSHKRSDLSLELAYILADLSDGGEFAWLEKALRNREGGELGTEKSKSAKPRLRGKRLPNVGTTSMVKGPGHLSSFKPLLQPGQKKD